MYKKASVILLLIIASVVFFQFSKDKDSDFVSYTANPKKENIELYWKNDKQVVFGSIHNLKNWLSVNNKKLVFAMNGGMYKKDQSPQGLFIQNKITKTAVDTSNGNGNFYLKPNGIFYLTTKNEAVIVKTEDFKNNNSIQLATQSGPMLVIDGKIHSAFNAASTNLNIRNGVGILPNGEILFAMSAKEVNFYEFANYFKQKGCKNALYLDGLVSRVYCPKENSMQTDGNFGVIIGITQSK